MQNISHDKDFNVVRQFEYRVKKTPESIALNYKSLKLSYQALNEKANQIAQYLKKNQVTPGDFVGILLEPSTDFIINMLAIIKIGAAYLPLDTLAPSIRLNEILEDAQPKIVITDKKFSELIDNKKIIRNVKDIHITSVNYLNNNFKIKISPKSPIYMMYTSGSTGRPKGVIIPHQAVANLTLIANYASVKPHETVAQFSNLAFDACTFEIWSALLNGATLNIVPNHIRTNTDKLCEFFAKNSIDYLFLPTAYFHQIIKSFPATLDNIPKIVFGGEQVNLKLLKDFIFYRKGRDIKITLINGYGPTEATTFTCRNIMTEKDVAKDDFLMSIGQPFQNIKTYVLDEKMQSTKEGELYISGINLALGYHNSKAQNKEKFIQNPFFNEEPYTRLYKTGDKVRLLPNGNILCLGRLDDQVKVGGFRIHLNEIEKKLMDYPNIALTAVTVEIGGGQHKMLTAYIVLSDKSQAIHVDNIRNFLEKSLPAYMLPSKYVIVEELPLTLVGKVDKKKLDKIQHTDISVQIDASNSHSIEKNIQNIWCHLLNRISVDIHKNFFDLGANSLLIAESCTLINKALNASLKIVDILSHPTIHKLTCYIAGDVEILLTKKHKTIRSTDIAIIGMSCRFPKASSLKEFWDNICNQVDCLERFELTDEDADKKNYVPARGILFNISYFDADFFGFNPVDASITDPQHRVFLEVAWEALEHAGVAPQKSSEKIISVFSGMTDSTYLQDNLLKNNWFLSEHDHFQQRIANSMGMLSTQLSYRLNLKGRSINVNTACSTGLIAVDQACQDLIIGNSDIALAGAVSIVVPQQKGYQYQEGSILSPNGICAPFADIANGTVFSNGVGVVILKRLQDAVAEGDVIYAVIKGRGVNNDGSDKLGYAAPSRSGQIACILSALEDSKLTAQNINYIEAHGTATLLGDIVEFDALKDAFKVHTKSKEFCALGTVKSNIGHTDVVAGIAGLIKTILCLHHQYIPPMPRYENPNPELGIDGSPFFINKEPIIWNNKAAIHYAGVSAFGVGGTNAHMVLSEYRALKKSDNKKSKPLERLFILSAKSQKALEDMTENFIRHTSQSINNIPDFLQRAAYTLQTSREDFAYRRYAIGQNTEEIKVSFSKNPMQYCEKNTDINIVFMFPGQGTQYPQMAQELMQISYFSNIVGMGATIASQHLNCHFLSLLQAKKPKEFNETQYAQPALFIIEYALAKLLMRYGLQPNALIGHSLGEYVAACIAGVFSFEDGVALICARGMLMARAPKGAMLAIQCSAEAFLAYQSVIDGIAMALHNSPNHCVASGTQEAIHQLEKHLSDLSVSHQRLKVSHAFHSHCMEPIKDYFIEMLSKIHRNTPNIPILSNLTGDWLSAKDAVDPEYWYKHLRHTVKLNDGLMLLSQNSNSFFIEVGPGRSLSVFLKTITQNHSNHQHFIIQSLSEKKYNNGDLKELYTLLGQAWQRGAPIHWAALYGEQCPQKTALPFYPFQRQPYWLEADKQLNPLQIHCFTPAWTRHKIDACTELSKNTLEKYTWVIIKDFLGLAEKFISFFKENGITPITIEPSTTHSQHDPSSFKINLRKKEHYVKLMGGLKNKASHPIFLNLASYGAISSALTSHEAIEKQLSNGFYSLLYLSQAFIAQFSIEIPLKVALITNGTHKIVGPESINPINATLIGASSVLMQEQPSIKIKCFDLNPEETLNHNIVHKIIKTCIHKEWQESNFQEFYRNGYRWNLFYSEIGLNKNPVNRLKKNGVYLLTGGLGGIALSCCEAITQAVSTPTFILLSRTALPEEITWRQISKDPNSRYYETVQRILALKDMGATISIHEVDITELNPLKALVQQCIKIFGRINGLIHAAGISQPGLMQSKTVASIQKVFAPKIHGTFNLIKVFEGIPLDFVVLKSSLSSILGGFEQIDYSAANSFLDSVSTSGLFTSAAFVLCINWNTWREVGIAARNKHEGKGNFIGKGDDISPHEGKKLFIEILNGENTQVAISKLNINDVQSLLSKSRPSLQNIARKDLSISTKYLPPSNKIESMLALLWQEALGINQLGITDDFFSLGGHSLIALGLIEKINKSLNCMLPVTQIYRTPTIQELGAAISDTAEPVKPSIIIPLKVNKKKPPFLFLCHPVSGLLNCFDAFVKQSNLRMSIYGLQDPSIERGNILYKSLSSMVDDYLSAIKKIQPLGPYYLLGYSFGGVLCYEIAHKLVEKGEKVQFLGLIDSWAINPTCLKNSNLFKKYLQSENPELPEKIITLAWEREKLLINHTISKSNMKMLLFKALEVSDVFRSLDNSLNGWQYYNSGKIIYHSVDGTHESIMNHPYITNILYLISEYLKIRQS